jgi:hypothetical protein
VLASTHPRKLARCSRFENTNTCSGRRALGPLRVGHPRGGSVNQPGTIFSVAFIVDRSHSGAVNQLPDSISHRLNFSPRGALPNARAVDVSSRRAPNSRS